MTGTETKGTSQRVLIEDSMLWVDGVRTLLLPAEVHNSSTSTGSAIRESFARIAALGADTVLAPVAWYQLEPAEGTFRYELVDERLEVASLHRLRLVLLWFGSCKNGESSYVPECVKLAPERSPRSATHDGEVEVLSTFAESNRTADAAAFVALMRHLAATDTDRRVVMVQVENEVGLLGDSRDRSALAEQAWQSAVPPEVLAAIRAAQSIPAHEAWLAEGSPDAGTWAEVLGDGADAEEAFMAWAYASYVEAVAAAGAAEYALPLLVNAWLDADVDFEVPEDVAKPVIALAGGQRPGVYPSGGPVFRVAPIWRAAAPTVDLLAPDIYFGGFNKTARMYREAAGALFIPEMRRDAPGVAQMFRAVGEYGAIGASPFGADSFVNDSESAPLHDGYRLLRIVADALATSSSARTHGLVLTAEAPTASCRLGDYELTATAADPHGLSRPAYPAYAVIVEEEPGRFLVVGRGFTVTCRHEDGPAFILSADEVNWVDGRVLVTRGLGGDETGAGTAVRFPAVGVPDPSFFPIPGMWEMSGAVRLRYYRPRLR